MLDAATAADPADRAGEPAAAAAVAVRGSEPSAPLPADLTAAAFFDVDNTMMVGASIFHFARGLAARKFFTTSDLLGFAWQQVKFRVGGREGSTATPPAATPRWRSSPAARWPRSSSSARRSTTS